MAKELAGVEDTDVAGQEEELDFGFNFEGEEGDDTEDAADPADEEEADGDDEGDEEGDEPDPEPESRTEKAFAKRLAAEKEKLAKQLREELLAELKQNNWQQNTPQTQPQTPADDLYADMPRYTREQVEDLADNMGTTPEAAWQFLCNQHATAKIYAANKKLEQELQQTKLSAAETRQKNDAIREVAKLRKANGSLPAFDEKRITQIRADYKRDYGIDLPYLGAYRMMVSEDMITGKTTRQVEQRTINNIANRDAKSVRAGGGGRTQAKSIEDIDPNSAEFDKLYADVMAGKYKAKNNRRG